MVDQTSSGSLSVRVRRLELLLLALLLAESEEDSDELFYLFRRFFRDEKRGRPPFREPEWEFLLERLIAARRRSQPESLSSEVSALRKRLYDNEETTKSVAQETHALLSLQALGIPSEKASLTRYIPVRAYFSEVPGGTAGNLTAALTALLEASGFSLADEFPVIRGSWFRKWFAKSKEALTQPEVAHRLEKIERAVELKTLNQPQADVDDKQATAIAKLVTALHDVPNAAVQAGSVLVVKLTTPNGPVIQARTLSQDELVEIENNQLLLQDPAAVLGRLSDACSNSKGRPSPRQIKKSG